jgi:hypothetical protein
MSAVDFKERLLAGLGGTWPEPGPLNVRLRERIDREGYHIESLYYDAEPEDVVPAMLLVPEGVTRRRPAPAVICLHQHQFHLGKHEPAGLAGAAMHQLGPRLAREGYVVLCFDAICFGERKSEQLKDMDYERFVFLRELVNGRCMAWKNILDIRRAVDFLVSRKEVRDDRIGCYGHSMGSTHTWMAGPWEPRIRCLVCNCCLPTYKGIHREQMLHCYPNFVPGINQHGDMQDIVALIAPRPLQMNFGDLDEGSPIDCVREGLEVIARQYEKLDARESFSYLVEEKTGHVMSEAMWKATIQWFDRHLASG